MLLLELEVRQRGGGCGWAGCWLETGRGSEWYPAPQRVTGYAGTRALELLEGPTQRWTLGTGGSGASPHAPQALSPWPHYREAGAPREQPRAPGCMAGATSFPESPHGSEGRRPRSHHRRSWCGPWGLNPSGWEALPWRLPPANGSLCVSSRQGGSADTKARPHESPALSTRTGRAGAGRQCVPSVVETWGWI